MKFRDLTHAKVSAHFHHLDGRLYRKIASGNQRVGDEARSLDADGYIRARFLGVTCRGHHLVWMLEHGAWAGGEIDHVDGDRTNNSPSNLRIASKSQNQANRAAISGAVRLKGVTVHKQTGKFQVSVGARYVGLFSTAEEAARAYDRAAIAAYGEFAKTNSMLAGASDSRGAP